MNTQVKKLKVTSKLRLMALMLIVFLLIINVVGLVSLGVDTISDGSAPQYVEVSVVDGDTLWNIADQYMPDNMDIREAINIIINTNHMVDKQLEPGQVLQIPVYS